jgi:hypothetical protein
MREIIGMGRISPVRGIRRLSGKVSFSYAFATRDP